MAGWELAAVDLDLVGLILMAVAFLGTAVYVSVMRRRRNRSRPSC
ncbi:hypothetical protein [Streptomyces sp. NPDC056191]